MRPHSLLALVVLLTLLTACGGGGGGTTPDPLSIVSVNLPATVTLNEVLTLSASTTGDVASYDWAFGGGGTPDVSTAQSPRITFAQLGFFDGVLTIRDAAGATDSFTFHYTVTAPGIPTEPPTIQAVGPGEEVGFEGQSLVFQASVSTPATGWEWEFKEGATPRTSTLASPAVSLRGVGSYLGRVRARNGYGTGEWQMFRYNVTAQTVSWRPVLVGTNLGPNMGAPGERVEFTADYYNFPFRWFYEFFGGTTLESSDEARPAMTLGPEGYYRALTTAENRDSLIQHPHVYSVGDIARREMLEHWGGAGGTASSFNLVPLSEGRVAGAFPARAATGLNPLEDLDPRFTTIRLGHPTAANAPLDFGGLVAIYQPDGAIESLLAWDNPRLLLQNIHRGPSGLLAAFDVRTPGMSESQEVDVEPGPGVTKVTVASTGSIIVCLSDTGAFRWSFTIPARGDLRALVTGPEASVYYLAQRSAPSITAIGRLASDGSPLFESSALSSLSALAGAPDGGVFVASEWERSPGTVVDFDPTGGFDNQLQIGARDAYLTRYNADGSYRWTRRWGGPPDGTTATGSAVTADVVLVRPDNSVVVFGTDYQGSVDFDPGPGAQLGTLPSCSSSSPSSGVFALHLNANGNFTALERWYGRAAGTLQAADLGTNGYILAFDATACANASANDLDPGPAMVPSAFADRATLVRIGADGTLQQHVSWDAVTFGRITPGLDGGLFVSLGLPLSDIDPGPGMLDLTPILLGQLGGVHLFLNDNLEWSVP